RAAATRATALGRRWLATRAHADAAAAIEQRLAIARSPAVAASIRVAAARDAAALARESGSQRVALEAAHEVVQLLPLVAGRGLAGRPRAGQLTHWQEVGVDAAATALLNAEPGDAAVLVEQGRAVLWAQTLDARSELHTLRVRAPELADRLSRVRAQLDV